MPRQEHSWRPMLAALPVPNAAARVEDVSGGGLKMFVQTKKPWYFVPPVSWVVPLCKERIVILDRIGAVIWRLCDGVRTVEQVVDAFAGKYDLTFHESRTAVTGYMKLLIRRSVLVIAMEEEQV